MIGDVESFLFSILVLGHLRDHKGYTWRREIAHMYAIEVTLSEEINENIKMNATCQLLNLFPSAHCRPPKEDNAVDAWNGMIGYMHLHLFQLLTVIYNDLNFQETNMSLEWTSQNCLQSHFKEYIII